MPDISTDSYTLSELAQIVGVEEKTLHLFAHKGLLNPVLIADSSARFTDVDCARLRIIKRADEIGYEPENIFNLIGEEAEVLDVEDSLSACQQFATEKYKQIFDELNHCEPLEKLNKKCDLKLLKNYLRDLEGPHMETALNSRSINVTPPKRPDRTPPSRVRTSSKAPEQTSARSPKVLSYSVNKLWDYVNKADAPNDETDAELLEQTRSSRHEEQFSEPPYSMDDETQVSGQPQESFEEPDEYFEEPDDLFEEADEPFEEADEPFEEADEPFEELQKPIPPPRELLTPPREPYAAPAPYNQYRLKARSWSSGLFSTSGMRNMLFVGLLIALGVIGYLWFFKDTGVKVTKIKDTEAPPSSSTEQSPPQKIAEKPAEGQLSEQNIESKAHTDQSALKEGPGQTTSGDPNQMASAASVQVENVSLWHDNMNKIYRADFTIRNVDKSQNRAPVSGYAFVHLSTTGDETAEQGNLLMPAGELQSGTPSMIRQGAIFSIKNLIDLSIKTTSDLPPNDVASGKVLVFSTDGDLLLEKPFSTPIQPFFTAAKDLPVPPAGSPADEKSTPPATDSSPPAATAKVEQTTPKPAPEQAQVTDQQTTAVAPNADNSGTPPVLGPQTNTAEQAASTQTAMKTAPQGPEANQPSAQTAQPAAKIEKTDQRDAAALEQSSYDAAVNGDFDQAIVDATKAIEMEPDRMNPYINRSWAYIETNKMDLAIEDCKLAIQIDPQNPYAYNNRGLAYQRQDQVSEAQDDYRMACDLGLDLACQNLDSLLNESRVTELMGQSETAFNSKDWDTLISTSTEVIELDPENATAYTNRSAAYAQKNFLVKALRDSNEAIKNNPKFALAYNNRGYVFELLGNTRKAADDYKQSCSLGLELGCKNFEKLN